MAITIKSSVLLVLFFFLSIGCTPKRSTEELLISAQKYIQDKDQSSAVIELKNVIKLQSNNIQARIMLGNIYLSSGNGIDAQKEFEKAETHQGDPDKYYPALARALYLQYKPEDILSLELNYLNNEESMKAVLFYKGAAAYQMGELEQAERFFNESKSIKFDSVFGQLSEVHLNVLQKNVKNAMKIVNDILVVDPENLDALYFKARLSLNLRSYPEAVSLFEQYSKLQPNDLQSLLILASAYVKNSQYDEAESLADKLLKIAPYNGLINQIKGVARYYNKDMELASLHLNKAIQNNYTTTETLLLAGLSEFQLENYEQALTHLQKIEAVLPNTHLAKKIIAIIRIQLGYDDGIESDFANLENLTEQDASLLNAASYELFKEGKLDGANTLLNQSIALNSQKPDDIIRQGTLRLSMQDVEGIADLERALELDPNSKIGKSALASAYLSTKNYDKALKVANEWQKNNDIAGFNLAGIVYSRLNEIEKAEAAFSSALIQNKTNVVSLMFFISKALKNKATDVAFEHLNTVLTAYPNYLPGISLNYAAHKQNGDSSPGLAAAKKFVENAPDNLNARLLYAEMLVVEKQPKKVIQLLSEQTIEQENITLPYFWLVLGDSYIATKQYEKALYTFEAWTKAMPNSRAAWIKVISIHEVFRDYSSALKTTQQALKQAVNDQQLRLIETRFLIETENFEQAQLNIDTYFSANNEYITGVQGLEGRILLGKKQYKAAQAKLLPYYKARPNLETVTLVYTTYIAMKQQAAGNVFLEEHLNSHPKDVSTMLLLANSKSATSPLEASRLYQSILDINPSNVIALNNLAWLKLQNNSVEEADRLAQDGLKIYPNSVTLLDTAANIKEKIGDIKNAKILIEKALKLAPTSTEIQSSFKRISKL
ncbi:MAG: putative PEP-CTERM system TPR-repeat lipoprotein [Colwellia sp.]|jgi:putative PEP-CTERM system TPR-repeat lipoprotein